ncbi:MAG: hypothetical protein ABL999_16955 [Pyrinomonadaceae bacterium]
MSKIDSEVREIAGKTVVQKIRETRRKILDDEGTFAADLRDLAIEAFKGGMNSKEWEDLMKNYADSSAQLNRLCGRDKIFNRSDWGMACIVYVAGNSSCGTDTATMTGTERGFHRVMSEQMDEFDYPLTTPNLYPPPDCENVETDEDLVAKP